MSRITWARGLSQPVGPATQVSLVLGTVSCSFCMYIAIARFSVTPYDQSDDRK